jgi:glycosyltransferase involved in cell wall biosynthesis
MPPFVDHILIVDDASTDRTAEEGCRLGDPRVEVIRHPVNAGVGAAIVTGYKRARDLGADVVAVMAGDGQMHPDDLGAVVGPVAQGNADYVKGNRLAHPTVRRVMPRARRLATMALGTLTGLAAGLHPIHDSQCGFTAISRSAIDNLATDLDGLWPRYGYPNDLLGALARHGLRVSEATVRPVYRDENSGVRPWHVLRIGYLIARIALRRRMLA